MKGGIGKSHRKGNVNMDQNRPFVVCHMLSSLDGRISGDFFSSPMLRPVMETYRELREQYRCSAVLSGSVTASQIYAEGYLHSLKKADRTYEREDYVFESGLQNYIVAVDTEGKLRWRKNYMQRTGQPRAHVISVLTADVSDDFLCFLRNLNISYIFAGEKQLDEKIMLRKLKKLFGIERVMCTGGGILNWSLLQAGCVDEVSVVVAPFTDGRTDTASLFDRSSYVKRNITAAFSLAEIKKIKGDGVWMRYIPR